MRFALLFEHPGSGTCRRELVGYDDLWLATAATLDATTVTDKGSIVMDAPGFGYDSRPCAQFSPWDQV